MRDALQDVHSKALSGCVIVTFYKWNANCDFQDVTRMIEVEKCRDDKIPMHLKLVMYHKNCKQEGIVVPIDLCNMELSIQVWSASPNALHRCNCA